MQGQPPSGHGTPPSSTEMVEKTVAGLSRKIALSSEEKSSLDEIFTDFFSEMDNMHKSGSRPDRSKMEKLENEQDEKIKEVLSEEKFEAYSKFMKNYMKPPEGEEPPQGH